MPAPEKNCRYSYCSGVRIPVQGNLNPFYIQSSECIEISKDLTSPDKRQIAGREQRGFGGGRTVNLA